MNLISMRGRVLLPLVASAVGLPTAGWFALQGGDDGAAVAARPAETASATTLDAIENAWQSQQLTAPTAPRQVAELAASRPRVDPFVQPAAVNAGLGDRYASAAPAEPAPLGTIATVAETPVARGQQPEQAKAIVPAAVEIPTGNPLRGGGVASERARRAFEDQEVVDAADGLPREPGPIRVDLGPDARIRPVAAESPAESLAALAAGLPEAPAALPGLPVDNGRSLEPTAQRSVDPLPLVDPPIEIPSRPEARSVLVAPRDRVATRDPMARPSAAPRTNEFDQPTDFGATPAYADVASSAPAMSRPGDPSLEGRQQPSIAVQKFAPAEIQVGKPSTFTVKIRNDSPRPVAGVVVEDRTPAGTQLLGTNPQADTSGDHIRWQVGSLAPGEQRAFEMEVVPTEEGEIGSVATVMFAAQASARARSTRPLLALRMTAPSRVLVGRQQRVKIEIRNPGTGDATGVTLLEDIPENLRHDAGPSLEFEIGTLRAGESRTLELVMQAEQPGPVSNVLVARADGNLEVEQRVDFEVVAPALSVALEGPSRRYLERPATYTVRVENPGTAAARDIRLTARLPRGMRFVKANNMGEYDPSTHTVYWALAELPEGEGGKVELTAVPLTPGEMTLEAEGQAREGLRDKAAHRVRVEGIAAVGFEVLDVEDPIEVGGQTQYEVRVTNQGTKEATGVRVRLVAPAGMRVVSATGPTQHAIDAGGVTFQPIARLAPQGESQFRVRVEGVQPGDHRMTVEVSSDDLAQPVRKEESTRVFGDE